MSNRTRFYAAGRAAVVTVGSLALAALGFGLRGVAAWMFAFAAGFITGRLGQR